MTSLSEFQRDRPEAAWEELSDHIKYVAKTVKPISEKDYLGAGKGVYEEVLLKLEENVKGRRKELARKISERFPKEGLNPVGAFLCPYCLEESCDVEYAVPKVVFPSGFQGEYGADIDVGRCFQCGRVSYWILESKNGLGVAGALRRLLFPPESGKAEFRRLLHDRWRQMKAEGRI